MASELYDESTATKLERTKLKATVAVWAASAGTQPGDTFTVTQSNSTILNVVRVWKNRYSRTDRTRGFKTTVVHKDDGRESLIITRVE